MIVEVSGDILLTNAEVIAHGVAPNDDFATGLSHALRERAPTLYKDFRHYCQTKHPDAGGLWDWQGPGCKRVVSLLTQKGAYGHGEKPGHATTSNINHCLHALKKFIQHEQIKSVALPRLATGAGGLAWSDVKPLIQSVLGDVGIPVIVYSEYHSGVAANEGLK